MVAFVPASFNAVTTRPGAFTARKCTLHSRPVVAHRTQAPRMSIETSLANIPAVPLAADMAVTFPAYLAVFLGTLIPCAFLIILYIQDVSRKAGEKAGRGDE